MYRTLKTLLEWPLALLLLVLSAPLQLVLAFVVLLSDGRPVLHREMRVGKSEREFPLLKFRTLSYSTGPSVAPENDQRIFPAARWMRRWRLDEFPTLINVLLGDMSLTGPRPLTRKHADSLSAAQRSRLVAVRPGVTGPAALAFIADDSLLGEFADPEAVYLSRLLPQKVAMELRYLQNWSLALDCKLLALTLRQLWSRRARGQSRERIAQLLSASGDKNGLE